MDNQDINIKTLNMGIEKGAVDIEERKRDKSVQEKNIRRQNESFDFDPARNAFESNIEEKKALGETTLLTSSRPLTSVLHSFQSVSIKTTIIASFVYFCFLLSPMPWNSALYLVIIS